MVRISLLADPLRRDLVPEGVADLYIITEDVVVSDFEGGDAGAFGLALLHPEEVLLAVGREGAELVKLLVDTGGDDGALADLDGGILRERPENELGEFPAGTDLPDKGIQRLAALAGAGLHDRVHLRQAAAELEDFPGIDLAVGDPSEDAFHVADLAEGHLQLLQQLRLLRQKADDLVARREFLEIHHRHGEPAAEQTRAHRRGRPVDGLDEGNALPSRRAGENLEVPQCETIHPDKLSLVDAAERTDVPKARVAGLLEIDHQRPGRADAQREAVDGKALQRRDVELAAEFLEGRKGYYTMKELLEL